MATTPQSIDSPVLVDVQSLYKSFKRENNTINALSCIDIQLAPACFHAIAGPSGSGKSTLLNIIGMLDKPDQGSVALCGKDIDYHNDWELGQLRREKIGFVFQNFNLIPTLTALENVALPLFNTTLKASERMMRAKKCLHSVGLQERLHHFPRQLSGGQQQRVAIARALVNNPALVLADEPSANLDSHTAMQIMDLMSQIRLQQKVGFLFSSHDSQILDRALQVIYLKDGKVVTQ